MPARISAALLLAALASAPAPARDARSPAERLAVERCAPLVERYGRMRIDEVARDRRGRWRVDGTVGGAAIGDSNGWRRGFAPRAFTCTVGEDGQARLKTSRLRRY
jgi:hypothetical protein